MPDAHPGREEHGRRQRRRNQRRREVRLRRNEDEQRAQDEEEREHSAQETADGPLLANGERGGPEDDGHLGEFRGLEGGRPEHQPAAGPVPDGRDVRRGREDHDDEKGRHRREDRPREPPVHAIIGEGGDDQRHEADGGASQLAHEHVVPRKSALLRREGTRGIDGEEPEHDEDERDPDERIPHPRRRTGELLNAREFPREGVIRHVARSEAGASYDSRTHSSKVRPRFR